MQGEPCNFLPVAFERLTGACARFSTSHFDLQSRLSPNKLKLLNVLHPGTSWMDRLKLPKADAIEQEELKRAGERGETLSIVTIQCSVTFSSMLKLL